MPTTGAPGPAAPWSVPLPPGRAGLGGTADRRARPAARRQGRRASVRSARKPDDLGSEQGGEPRLGSGRPAAATPWVRRPAATWRTIQVRRVLPPQPRGDRQGKGVQTPLRRPRRRKRRPAARHRSWRGSRSFRRGALPGDTDRKDAVVTSSRDVNATTHGEARSFVKSGFAHRQGGRPSNSRGEGTRPRAPDNNIVSRCFPWAGSTCRRSTA